MTKRKAKTQPAAVEYDSLLRPPAPIKPLPPHLQEVVDLLPLNVPVHRSTLEEKYGRQEAKRRLRKIRGEYGWAIKSGRKGAGAGANNDWYTRLSDGPVRDQCIRYEVTKANRLKVYVRDDWTCRICKCDVSPQQTATNPQCDHKVPASRRGRTILANLQTICTTCNLKKRQACNYCTLTTCAGCPYAFPENFRTHYVIALSESGASKLEGLAARAGMPPAMVIAKLLDAR